METEREAGSGNLIKTTTIIAAAIVGYILLSNTVALILSFPTVLSDSPRVYESGIEGSIQLPFVPWTDDDLIFDLPPSVPRNSSFTVLVRSTQGSPCPFTMYLVLGREDGRTFRFRLFPEISEEGSHFQWTLVPPGLPVGNYSISISYGESIDGYTRMFHGKGIEITPSDRAFVRPLLDDDLRSGEVLRIHPESGGRDGDRNDIKAVRLINSAGERIELSKNTSSGDFELDTREAGIRGWNRMSVETILFDDFQYSQGELLFLAPYDENGLPRVASLEMSRPFSGYDELFGQGDDEGWNMDDEDINLLTSTYYRINITIRPRESRKWDFNEGTPNTPFPRPVISIEGMEAHLLPLNGNGSFTGIFKTPSGYDEDPDNGMEVRIESGNENCTIMTRNVVLDVRQAPLLEIEPDPFSSPLPPGSNITVKVGDGWELVSYRRFGNDPVISLDGKTARVQGSLDGENKDMYIYRAVLVLENGSRGQNLHVSARTDFRMEWTFYLIPVTIAYPMKGIMIPLWFVLISFAILVSLAVLATRSLRGGKGRGGGVRDLRNPLKEGSELALLATTFMGALFFSWTVYFLFQIMEQPTPIPDVLSESTPDWIQMILLANASVWEEITSRVMLIGVPLAVIELARTNKGRRAARQLLGGRGWVDTPEFILIMASSMIFGFLHLGWGPWKVVPTFVTGALFGYLYVKVGLHASIAMHFLFDYDGFIYDLIGIPYTQAYILYYFALLFGGFFLAYILTRTKWFLEERSGRRMHPGLILLIHSLLSLLVMTYLIFNNGDSTYILLLAGVPILNLAGYIAAGRKLPKLSITLVTVSSFVTLPLAPVGLIWIFDRNGARRRG